MDMMDDTNMIESELSPLGKRYKKRSRTLITPEQLTLLENLYEEQQWPSKIQKKGLAHDLRRSETFVSVWFQNKRARVKREDDTRRAMNVADSSTSTIMRSHTALKKRKHSVKEVQKHPPRRSRAKCKSDSSLKFPSWNEPITGSIHIGTSDEQDDVDVTASDSSVSSTMPSSTEDNDLRETVAEADDIQEDSMVNKAECNPYSIPNEEDVTRSLVNKQMKLTKCGQCKISTNIPYAERRTAVLQTQTKPIDLRVNTKKLTKADSVTERDASGSTNIDLSMRSFTTSDFVPHLTSSSSSPPTLLTQGGAVSLSSSICDRSQCSLSTSAGSSTAPLGYIQAKRICFSPGDKQRSTLWVRLPRRLDEKESKCIRARVVRSQIGVKVPTSLRLHKGCNTSINVPNIITKKDHVVHTCTSNETTTTTSSRDSLLADKRPVESYEAMTNVKNTASVAGHHSSSQGTLFHTLMNMVAVAEGGLLPSSHNEYSSGVNNALYGILINNTHRLVYDKDYGLDLVHLEC